MAASESANPSAGSILLTGANGGFGRGIVSAVVTNPSLAALHGLYTVRDASAPAPGLEGALNNRAALPHSHQILSLDLSRLASVRQTAAQINELVSSGLVPPIRALVLNAGYSEYEEQTFTEDRFDMSFQVNYLGHWLLTMMVLGSMDREHGRIIVLGSTSHDTGHPQQQAGGQFKDPKWKIVFDKSAGADPVAKGTHSSSKDDPSWRGGLRRYGAGKLCGLLMIGALQRRLDSDSALGHVKVLGFDPGTMPSEIVRRAPWLIRVFIFKFIVPAGVKLGTFTNPNGTYRTIKKSAADLLALALSSDPPLSVYTNGSELGEMSAEARDEETQEMLWRDTMRYAQLRREDTVLENWM